MLDTLLSVNLSLSSACGADCIYCPAGRGKRIQKQVMSYGVAKIIIDEITSIPFYEKWKTIQMQIGENGDCFINKNTIDILRYIKKRRPDIKLFAFTNLENFSTEKMEIVCAENLLDFIAFNFDGSSEETFFGVKRLSKKYLDERLPILLELRERHNANFILQVQMLTMKHYIKAVELAFGRLPARLKDLSLVTTEDDSDEIRKQIQPMLREGDRFGRSVPYFWAEREAEAGTRLEYEKYDCPLIGRICHEAFIAPDGTWYACCFDGKNELALGNVVETSVEAVAEGQQRREFVDALINKRFGEIGGPCATVHCCQGGITAP
jgi:radical SAM protein with 4Fe4S-binding SPASM domain